MDIENSITNHTEFSGGNDTSDSSAAEQHKDSSAAEQHKDSSAAEQHKDSSAAEQHKAKAISPEDAVRNISSITRSYSNYSISISGQLLSTILPYSTSLSSPSSRFLQPQHQSPS
ncbi:hypothetical protein MJO28_000268 [Puccinia striiformis f. sp. tritici]|uniref:Uncharacterized protein n=1 Tax=Puccinia striiformis f. sp. tritici TaxID=168172 RepID=A0ACC0EWR9_9BASI|nr:hypothetical protein MJO28_000268 [Puccinia striiformis f. sp. tritici]KAI7967685.1 hypothetical protein MJO29_000962 [Puccinia striiformis f. sp. tritici]KAI9600820.1 hypothetical protein H4Q26_000613 [Puccinia striiformis f. sp. tritici PST-130]